MPAIAFGLAGVQIFSGLVMWAINGPEWKKFCAFKAGTATILAGAGAVYWLLH